MAEVSVSEAIPASADRVWSLIGGFGSLTRWLPPVSACSVEGNGVGAIRTLAFAGSDVYAKERLDAIDDTARAYTYSVTDTDIPLAAYRSTIRVDSDGDRRCTLSWSSKFEATDGTDAALASMIEQNYRDGIARIIELLGD